MSLFRIKYIFDTCIDFVYMYIVDCNVTGWLVKGEYTNGTSFPAGGINTQKGGQGGQLNKWETLVYSRLYRNYTGEIYVRQSLGAHLSLLYPRGPFDRFTLLCVRGLTPDKFDWVVHPIKYYVNLRRFDIDTHYTYIHVHETYFIV